MVYQDRGPRFDKEIIEPQSFILLYFSFTNRKERIVRSFPRYFRETTKVVVPRASVEMMPQKNRRFPCIILFLRVL